jgi:uncharacterized protein YjdB
MMKKYFVILTAALVLGCWACGEKEENPVIAVSSVSVSPTSVSIVAGTSATVTATVLPEDADNKAVAWASANSAVATVAAGVITGIAAGTTTVTVTTADGGRTASVAVTVTAAPVPVTSVSVAPTEVTIVEGTAATITATVAPANATNKSVAWTSSSDAIATVANGVVTGVAPGAATITVETEDGGYTATVAVTVESAVVSVTGVTVDPTTLSLIEGTTGAATATVVPANADNKNVAWTTSAPGIATVSDAGVITGVAPGTATITVTTEDGGFTAAVAVTVTAVTLSLNAPAAGAAIALDKTTPSASVSFSWTTNAPAGATFDLVVSQNSDLSSPLVSVPVTGGSKAYTYQELQDLLFTGASLTAGIKRYKPNTLYWNVKLNGNFVAATPAGSFTLTGMLIYKDVRGPETIIYDVAILNYGGQEHIWLAENFHPKYYPNGVQITYRNAAEAIVTGGTPSTGLASETVGGEPWTSFLSNAGWNPTGNGVPAGTTVPDEVKTKIMDAHKMIYDIWARNTTYYGNTPHIEELVPAGWKIPSNVEVRSLFASAGASAYGVRVLYDPEAFSDDFAQQRAVGGSGYTFSSKANFNDWKMNLTPGLVTLSGGMFSWSVQYTQVYMMCRVEGDPFFSMYYHWIVKNDVDTDVLKCHSNTPVQAGSGTDIAATNDNARGVAIRLKYIGE